MDISEAARLSGLPASTLRYYEKRGLIESVGRSGQRRVFDDGVVQRLALISLGRSAGFSIDELATMFGPDGSPTIDRGALLAKADELDARIKDLTAMRDGLRHTAACPAPSHLECRTFQRLLALATGRQRAAPRGRAPLGRSRTGSQEGSRPTASHPSGVGTTTCP